MPIPQFRITEAGATPIEVNLGESEPGQDWYAFLASQGWQKVISLPETEFPEFCTVSADIYHCEQPRPTTAYFIDISVGSYVVVQLFPVSGLDLLRVLRDRLLPLISRAYIPELHKVLQHFEEVLLDGDDGIPCAQRFAAREQRELRHARELRQKQGVSQ